MSKRKVISRGLLKNAAKGLAVNLVGTLKTSKKILDYPAELNPFRSALSQIRLSEYENLKLSEFLEKAISAKSVDELSKIIDEALDSGIRINAHNEDGFSFSHVVVLKMLYSKFTENKQKNIIKKLALNGADFDELGDEIEICDKIKEEAEPQIHNRLTKLREVAETAAVVGSVKNVEIDNKTFFLEFSSNCVVDVAKAVEGARSLGLNKGDLKLGSNIIRIGDGEVELKTGENGERNYADVSDGSSFTITFSTSLGELHVRVYNDARSYDQVKIEVENKESWNELQKTEEIVGQGCLFGGMSVKAAIEKGNFVRSGRWGNSRSTEIIKCIKPQSSETIWVDKIKSSKIASVERS
ncbi:MAG: hypothetical protein PG981_001461 [Wolbachia endosymbiont of Ctenocephalides orientis wCori]|nr:MAG: hypothetical protein PG981_001461 [Wolbachia endosymbiont of Ctenocephalides orientis wCori]